MTCPPFLRAALLVAAFVAAPALAQATERASIAYSIAPDHAARSFRIDVRVDGATEPAVELRMPSWQPASYALQPYAGAASRVEARDEQGAALRVSKPDADSWRVEASGRPFTLSYALDVSDKQKLYSKSYCYETAGAIQAGATLVYLPAHRRAPVRVALELPESWQVATPMQGGPRAFTAADYDELVDSPILFGDLRRADFAVRGLPFSAAWDARLGFDETEIVSSLSKMAEIEIGLFGEAPFDRYAFLYLRTPDPSGNGDESLAVGIEHARSTLITLDPVLAAAPMTMRHVLAETNAHELFHAWNVKAIRPTSLDRPDYATAPRVRSLWLLEGVTSYYADRVVAAIDVNHELAAVQLRTEFASVVSAEPHGRSVEQVALDLPRAGLEIMAPIYVRGEGLGLLLDVELRVATANRAGLDDVMRLLYERSRRGDEPFDEDELPAVFSKVAGRDMRDFFHRYVAGSETPPVERILASAGWQIGDAPVRVGPQQRTVRALVETPRSTPLQQEIRKSILNLESKVRFDKQQ